MLIKRFEDLKRRFRYIVYNAEITADERIDIEEAIEDLEEFIEENELYYRIEELKNMLNILEFKIDCLSDGL